MIYSNTNIEMSHGTYQFDEGKEHWNHESGVKYFRGVRHDVCPLSAHTKMLFTFYFLIVQSLSKLQRIA